MSTTEQEIIGEISRASAGATQFNQYMTANVTVTGTAVGPGVTIYVKSDNSLYPIAFSSGPPSDNTSGLQLTSTSSSGALPLSQINVTPDNVYFQTASSGSGGNQWSFVLQCYLAGESGLSSFEMSTNADSTVAVSISLNSGIPQTLGRGWTTFKWQPK
ncbi:hypothetical protein B1992_00170 [Pseudoxanthomonas broegbernensis]|uniref:Uncharacterized protein n=1 Tax=Pseudoxanthomonas broegbernensis TaxID=83619 RepID=A0A7V8GPX4_9GAMM|nr:hypothetical protein [Pseudoxanthomonas broegbernensis]KAF1687901.1 hypothetical protein B1992_00170 [Pseudoxanthomonas broegbernensis]MBB6064899.1 hypothetical protein [Pseudoxanthomonas broegbernensis]